jgi:spore coat polysaccharide biosynthesis predicted glycosyltransferase SpsG/CMP-N-acetylneuraminic acid synthetase
MQSKKDFCVIIPAIKKNAVISDQLVKKLDGETLIQRAINMAKEIARDEDIYIITDSNEIGLIAERNGVKFKYNANIQVSKYKILQSLQEYFDQIGSGYVNFILYRANTPLIDHTILWEAYNYFLRYPNEVIISVKKEKRRVLKAINSVLEDLALGNDFDFFEEVNAFQIGNFEIVKKDKYPVKAYELTIDRAIEINSYQSWWICEKLLRRKRIIFNVIGSRKVGTGHIFRSLALAHEITDHEVIFICDEEHETVVNKIVSTDYKLISSSKKKIFDTIMSLKPDLIINDILNTSKEYIKRLKTTNAKIVSFEDLGSGSSSTDLTINELYDIPQRQGENYLWGHEYFFLRDEFSNAKPHEMIKNVGAVLITFGGTDQNNYTKKTLKIILSICKTRNIKIYIVCGPGYPYKEELAKYIKLVDYQNILFENSSGIISSIMEQTQIAICSNGRTVYELADMNIPSIVISHHSRENTHTFASLETGFINLGIFEKGKTEKVLRVYFKKLIDDSSYRELLFHNIKKYNFRNNKTKVLNHILSLIEK